MMTKSTSTRKEQLRLAQKRRREAQKAQGNRAVTFFLPEDDYKRLNTMAIEMDMKYAEVINYLLESEKRKRDLEEPQEEVNFNETEIARACEWAVDWIYTFQPEIINDEGRMQKIMWDKLTSSLGD